MLDNKQKHCSEDFSEDINIICEKLGIEIKNNSIPLKEEKTTAVDNALLNKKTKIKDDIETITKKEKEDVETCEKATQTISEYDNDDDTDDEQEMYRQYLLTQKNN